MNIKIVIEYDGADFMGGKDNLTCERCRGKSLSA